MFGNRIELFTLLGFKIYVDFSWLILAVLIVWSLAVGFFPTEFPGLTSASYWWMGVVGALGLFASIVVHELGHSVVARRYGIPMKGITLFIFGGVAEMTKEPPHARSEFFTAIAGPIVSVLIAVAGFGFHEIAKVLGWPVQVTALLAYLASINFIFAVFNMVPAFPLDGGRVLRAVLWGWKNDLAWATRISSALGGAFGIFLIAMGLISLFAGNIIGGIWWAVLGMFLRGASQASYQQVLLRQMLEGEPVRNFMCKNPVSVPSSTTIQQFIENYIYQHHHKFFPVLDEGRLCGSITLERIKEVPSGDWNHRTVGEMLEPCGPDNTIPSSTDAMEALTTLYSKSASRVMVVENARLVGILTLKDLLSFLALKLEIEGIRPPGEADHPPHSAASAAR